MGAFLAALAMSAGIGVVPDAHELAQTQARVARWLGRPGPAAPEGAVGLFIHEQTWGTFRRGRNAFGGPLRLGAREFAHGLGTHATSRVEVRLPGPASRFRATIGIDRNSTTAGGQGSVVFEVRSGDIVGFSSGVVTGADAPREIEVPLEGALAVSLEVGDAGDGVACDQADWADARVELADGTVLYLDELPVLLPPARSQPDLPVSFRIGGEALVAAPWSVGPGDGERTVASRLDPASAIRATTTIRTFGDFPAVEWLLELENTGSAVSPVLSDVLALDLSIDIPAGELVTLRHARGSTCEISDFLPLEDDVRAGDHMRLVPIGGRSSNGVLPFFDVDLGTISLVVAVGWSGQWFAQVERPEPGRLTIRAGQETLRTRLLPGERIRTPRILLLFANGEDPDRGANLFRGLLAAHYLPRVRGDLVYPPVAHPTAWAILDSGERANVANQLEMLNAAADLGVEVYWLDAYWFPGGFPGGVGTWTHRPEDFPEGLRPLGDAAHARGMGFCLWFEPERVARASTLCAEHPGYCLDLHNGGDLLYNLGDPQARSYMTDLLLDRITRYGVDIYREDFNTDPLPFLTAADETEREGMTELRFVEGLYAMWDGLRAARPDLVLDNCASGGRRIDLETVSRALTLWRSDFQDVGVLGQPNPLGAAAIAGQVQTVGLGRYVPLSAGSLYSFDPYSVRSATSGGLLPYLDLRGDTYDRGQARAAIAEVLELRPYFVADLHPLTQVTTRPTDWCAFQLDRPEMGDGVALIFRRHESPYAAIDLRLRGIDAGARYHWSLAPDYAQPEWRDGRGSELADLRVTIDHRPGSMLLRYHR